jgi:hypothetical protein
MSAQKHTPGPWCLSQIGAGFEIESSSGEIVAQSQQVLGDCRHEIRRANARLIAAAPELLEALQAIVNTKIAVLCERAADRATLEQLLFNASVAIEKATGGAA